MKIRIPTGIDIIHKYMLLNFNNLYFLPKKIAVKPYAKPSEIAEGRNRLSGPTDHPLRLPIIGIHAKVKKMEKKISTLNSLFLSSIEEKNRLIYKGEIRIK